MTKVVKMPQRIKRIGITRTFNADASDKLAMDALISDGNAGVLLQLVPDITDTDPQGFILFEVENDHVANIGPTCTIITKTEANNLVDQAVSNTDKANQIKALINLTD
jgi:hypothetical protein